MAIAPTGALFKSFKFDDIDSRDFGVYISGDYVFNSPERDIETIEIPGRNGAFILDKGRFHNITVTYPAGMFGSTGDDFAEGIRRFRNALAGKKGYCRLTDEYHPLEYRMAVYRGGLEVEPAATGGDNRAAQFDIVFECKPQRYLIQGDQPIAVEDGANLNNPTPFESRPLLQVYGYGDISINGETITIDDATIGEIIIANSTTPVPRQTTTTTFQAAKLATGNEITTAGNVTNEASVIYRAQESSKIYTIAAQTTSGDAAATASISADSKYGTTQIELPLSFQYGTSGTITATVETTITGLAYGVGTFTDVYTDTVTATYDGDATITLQTVRGGNATGTMISLPYTSFSEVYGNSTKSVLGEPLYFDMDIGEAYKIEDGEIISVNNAVSFPAELPVLQPGPNSIAFDDTVDELDIVPRWWEV